VAPLVDELATSDLAHFIDAIAELIATIFYVDLGFGER
jgi:hypothetical protein